MVGQHTSGYGVLRQSSVALLSAHDSHQYHLHQVHYGQSALIVGYAGHEVDDVSDAFDVPGFLQQLCCRSVILLLPFAPYHHRADVYLPPRGKRGQDARQDGRGCQKPRKKSGFMARLEEAQRQQQAMLREQQKRQGGTGKRR